jgi:hypothetical protein
MCGICFMGFPNLQAVCCCSTVGRREFNVLGYDFSVRAMLILRLNLQQISYYASTDPALSFMPLPLFSYFISHFLLHISLPLLPPPTS